MKLMIRVVVLLTASTLSLAVYAAEWKTDPAGSKLEFIPTYEGEKAPGVFKEFDTQLTLDPKKTTGNKLDVVVKTASADMNNSDMNEAIRDPEWFDAKKFPQAEFHATDIKPGTTPGSYVARGKLTIKGTQKDVSVPFKLTESGATGAMEGELTLDRAQFNVGTGDWANGDTIGLNVTVKFKVNLRKAK
jgi:polyisoprenoid-binding protein YceI